MSMIRKIYIFGAHSRAQTLAAYLQYLYPDIRVKAYLFDNEETNPDKIGEIPVLRLNGDMPKDTDCPVYICTRGVYHSQIIERLKQVGFEKDISGNRGTGPAVSERVFEKIFYQYREEISQN